MAAADTSCVADSDKTDCNWVILEKKITGLVNSCATYTSEETMCAVLHVFTSNWVDNRVQ